MFLALLLKISENITNRTELRRLGIELRLESKKIRTIENNYPNDINGAAFEVLSAWREKSANMTETEMKEVLKTALSCDNVGMHLVVSECF